MICFHPLTLYVEKGDFRGRPVAKRQQVPCGRCPGCRVNRAEDWANRMLWEADYHEHTTFVTLTYDPQFEPPDMSLNKRVLQLFFKRLRKELGDRKIRYFACGEYGETRGRAHYHAVVFGLGLADEEIVRRAWGFGFIQVAPFVRGRALYVASYLLKEVDASIDLVGRVKPFALMSKGLGLAFAKANAGRIIAGEHPLTVQGKPVAIPRYFRKKLDVDQLGAESARVETTLVHIARVRQQRPDLEGVTVPRSLIDGSVREAVSQAEKNFASYSRLKEKKDNGL